MRRASLPFAVALACGLAACGSADDASEDGAASALADASGFVTLIPTSGTARRECATELAQTYCSEASARAAADRCTAKIDEKDRIGCDGGVCVALFSPARSGACAEGPTYPTKAACKTPVSDDCAFYRTCLEADHACGEDGYALAFGERLCNAFITKRARFSPAGQTWLHAIRQCLEDELVPELGREQSCSDLEDRAFDSHLRCYTSPAHSLCDLSHEDALELTAVLNKDILNPHAIKQVGALLSACLSEKK